MASDSKPIYERIFETLKEDIRTRRYAVGDRVPSEKELADEYQVSRITSKKALELLAAEGLIVRRPGRGSFVAEEGSVPANGSWPAAQGTRRPMIGLVMTDFGNSFGTGIIYGMERTATDNGAFLLLRRSFGIPANEERAIKEFMELGVDGIIVFPAQGEFYNPEILKLVIEQYPLVLIDRHLKGVAASSISTDNASAAKLGANHLLDLGHKHICLLTPPPEDTTAIEDRIEGFVQAHAERGVAVNRSLWLEAITSTLPNSFTDENIEKDISMIQNHLQRNPSITAVFASEYNAALLARAAVERLGKRIPEQMSILCFDSPATTLGSGYRFTHLRQEEETIGELAVEQVLKQLQGDKVPMKTTLDARLVLGESTAQVSA